MGAKVDLTGKVFGRLTVIKSLSPDKWGNYEWLCKCECGNIAVGRSSSLIKSVKRSCGCLSKENLEQRWLDMKKSNNYCVKGQCVEVSLSNSNAVFICDLDVWNELKKYTWHLDDLGYARSTCKGSNIRFHNLVMPCSDRRLVVDHINRNKLDNRKSNLRIVSHKENALNSERCGEHLSNTEIKIMRGE